jgi:hypothetical protein
MTMMRGVYVCSLVGIACMTLAAAGQSNSQSSAPYKVPKTSFGQPDLEGVWSNNSATPLQRPAAWADKEFLTDDEVARVQQAARQLEQDGDALFGDELIVDTLQGHTESETARRRGRTTTAASRRRPGEPRAERTLHHIRRAAIPGGV